MNVYQLAVVIFAAVVAVSAFVVPTSRALWVARRSALANLALIPAILVVDAVLRRPSVGCAHPHSTLAYVQLTFGVIAEVAAAISLGAAIRAARQRGGAIAIVVGELAAAVAVLAAIVLPWLCGS